MMVNPHSLHNCFTLCVYAVVTSGLIKLSGESRCHDPDSAVLLSITDTASEARSPGAFCRGVVPPHTADFFISYDGYKSTFTPYSLHTFTVRCNYKEAIASGLQEKIILRQLNLGGTGGSP